MPARAWNPVLVGPGQSAVTVMPLERNSFERAAEKLRTYALEA